MQPAEPPPSYRELLGIPSLGRILLGMALSRTAASMLGVAMVLFTLDRFASPGLAGIVTFAGLAPGLLVSPIAGALLDRHGRARLIVMDQLVAAASLVAIAVLALGGVLTPLILVLVAGVAGLTTPLSSVGLRTLFPLIVPRRLWERVNAVDSNGYVVATLVGPPVAGVLVQVVGAPQALVLIALSCVASAVVFARIADPFTETSSTGNLLVDSWQGLRYTLLNPTLRGLGISLAIVNLGWGILTIVVPVLIVRDLALGGAVVGLAWAVSGLTGGVGAFVAGHWRTQGRERAMLAWPMVGIAVATAALIVSPTLPVIVAVLAVAGFLNGPVDVALFTIRQRRTDPAWLGRAFAVSMSLNFAGYPFGAAIGGVLVDIGVVPAVTVAVVVLALGAIATFALVPAEAPEGGSTGLRDPS